MYIFLKKHSLGFERVYRSYSWVFCYLHCGGCVLVQENETSLIATCGDVCGGWSLAYLLGKKCIKWHLFNIWL